MSLGDVHKPLSHFRRGAHGFGGILAQVTQQVPGGAGMESKVF